MNTPLKSVLSAAALAAACLCSSAQAYGRFTSHAGPLGARSVSAQAAPGQGYSRQVNAAGALGGSRSSSIRAGGGGGYQRDSSSTGVLGGSRSVQASAVPGQGYERQVTRTGPEGATSTRDFSVK